MSQRTTPRQSTLRTRAAVLAAGLGVSAALGAGVALAADHGSGDASVTQASAAPAAGKQPAVGASASTHAVQASTVKASAVQAAVEKAKAKNTNGWVKPVVKYKLTAGFGLGGGLWAAKHSGQDFAVSIGTSVKAAHNGTVVKAGSNGAGDGPAYGNAIVIRHDGNTFSQYAHLSKVNVKVGETVKAGESIARSGNTGNTTGPHLHFEIRTTANYGSAINPVNFLRSEGLTV